MKIINSKIYHFLTNLVNHILLTFLFLVFSLPILTIGPAINSLIHVVNSWESQNENKVFRPFVQNFFNSSFLVNTIFGILLILIGGTYYLNFRNLLPIQSQIELIITLVLFISLLIVIGIVINCYLLVNSLNKRIELNKLVSIIISFTVLRLGSTVLSSLIILLFVLLIFIFPPSVFFGISLVIKIIIRLQKKNVFMFLNRI